jgi:hypothetical protein
VAALFAGQEQERGQHWPGWTVAIGRAHLILCVRVC